MKADPHGVPDRFRWRGRLLRSAAAVLAVLALVAAGTGLDETVYSHGGTDGELLSPVARFLAATAVILITAHGLGWLARRFGQPDVVGEITAGLLLGPTALAVLLPGVWQWLFPAPVLDALGMTAQLGLVCFMFLLGWELDFADARTDRRALIAVCCGGFLVPFAAGAALAVPLYSAHSGPDPGAVPYVLFIGLALSITAVPVLARVLADSGLGSVRAGRLALLAAVIIDVASWGVLAAVLALAGTSGGAQAVRTGTLAIVFVAAMVLIARPALAAVSTAAARRRTPESVLLPVVLVGAIASAAFTESIGVHAIFGAFVFGAMMPRRRPVIERVRAPVRALTSAVLLPLYFASVGLHAAFTGFGAGASAWLMLLAVLGVAMVGKIGGVLAAGRAAGLPFREAAQVGTLMNCRGLTELVIADIGLRMGVIDARMFTVLVLVALLTTALTTPLLRLLRVPAAAPPSPLPSPL